MAFGLGSSFNEPDDTDQTSVQQVSTPAGGQVNPLPNPIQALLGKKKKSPRAPQALAQAISRSKRGRPSSYKFG